MDWALVLDGAGVLWVREGRRVRQASASRSDRRRTEPKVSTCTRQPSPPSDHASEFKFMTSMVSREKPIEYALMARLLIEERARGGYSDLGDGPGAGAFAGPERHGLVHPPRIRGGPPGGQRGRRA